jgi:hypothetical protein
VTLKLHSRSSRRSRDKSAGGLGSRPLRACRTGPPGIRSTFEPDARTAAPELRAKEATAGAEPVVAFGGAAIVAFAHSEPSSRHPARSAVEQVDLNERAQTCCGSESLLATRTVDASLLTMPSERQLVATRWCLFGAGVYCHRFAMRSLLTAVEIGGQRCEDGGQ